MFVWDVSLTILENLTFCHEAREKIEIPAERAFARSQPRTGQSNRASCVLVSMLLARIKSETGG